MGKLSQKDPTQWFPMPAVLVTSQPKEGPANIMGLGYIGFSCWDPPTLYLGMNTARYSSEVIKTTEEFVVNVPEPHYVLNMDYCGFVSGVNNDKMAAAGFTPLKASIVSAPLIKECPLNIECKLKKIIPLGSHEMFIGEVVATHMDEEYVNGGKQFVPILLLSRKYVALSEFICNFGESGGNPPDIE